MKHNHAKKLTKLTKGKVNVSYVPASYFPDDPDSTGHLFSAEFQEPELEEIVLDDRKPLCLKMQLFTELHRVAAHYMRLSNEAIRLSNALKV